MVGHAQRPEGGPLPRAGKDTIPKIFITGQKGLHMDLSAITSLISNLGFPIACCVVMFYMLYKEQQNHKKEMDTLTTAIDNNTLAIQTLAEKIGVNVDLSAVSKEVDDE